MTDFLRNFSWQFYFTLRVFARNLLRGNRRRNTFCIPFRCLAWDSNPGFLSNKPTYYLLDHGDFRQTRIKIKILKCKWKPIAIGHTNGGYGFLNLILLKQTEKLFMSKFKGRNSEDKQIVLKTLAAKEIK